MTYSNYLSPTFVAAGAADGSISGLAHPVDRDNVLARPELRVLRLRLAVPNTTKQGNKMNTQILINGETLSSYVKGSIAMAVDQASEYGGLDNALGCFFDNLRDTLAEYGINDQYVVADAEDEYNRLAAEARARAAEPTPVKAVTVDSLYISEAGTEGRYSLDGMNPGANSGEYDTSTEAVAEAKRLIAEGIADSYTIDGN